MPVTIDFRPPDKPPPDEWLRQASADELELGVEGVQVLDFNGLRYECSMGVIAFAGFLKGLVDHFDAGNVSANFVDHGGPWRLSFGRQGDQVTVCDDAGSSPSVVSYSELRTAVKAYLPKFESTMLARLPALQENGAFFRMLEGWLWLPASNE